IKRGWDWVGLSPAHLERVGGLVEVPALAASLTLSKGDFLRTGPRGAPFLAHRKAVQEAVAAQLAAWGEARNAEDARRPRTGRIERALQTVLADLPEDAELGRLEDSTVWVNEAHPAFRRAVALRAEDYHVALTVAFTLAPLTVEPGAERRFVAAFLARWGAAEPRRARSRRPR